MRESLGGKFPKENEIDPFDTGNDVDSSKMNAKVPQRQGRNFGAKN